MRKNNFLITYGISVFQFIKEKMPYYYFYLDVNLVQFFTKNRIGYWFFSLTIISTFRQEELSFFSPSYVLIRWLLAATASLLFLIKNAYTREFLERKLGRGVMGSLIKESPAHLILNFFKPFLFAAFLDQMIRFGEVGQGNAYNKMLFDYFTEKWKNTERTPMEEKILYEVVAISVDHFGLKRALVELGYFLSGLISYLLLICLLLLLYIIGIILLEWLKKGIKED